MNGVCVRRIDRMILTGENQSTGKKKSFATIPIWTGLCGERPATGCLGHGVLSTAQ